MRRALNENPVAQIVVVAVLLIAVAFLFATRVLQREDEAAQIPATPTATSSAASSPAPDAASGAVATPSLPAAPAQPPAQAVGEFEAGPGLPKALVKAYDSGDTVVLLVTRRIGIEDRELRSLVEKVRARDDASVFVTNAGKIARYSRVTQGVDVNRVPALVVLKPKRATKGDAPQASVSYGYRSAESVLQAIRDANYRGRDIPAYPE